MEIKIVGEDAAHNNAKARNDARLGKLQLNEKWRELGTTLREELSLISVRRVRMAHVALFLFTKLLHTRLFGLIEKIFSRVNSKRSPFEQLVESVSWAGEMPFSYSKIYKEHGKFDSRVRLELIENLWDWIYKKCSVCTIKDYSDFDSIFLVQRLPPSVLLKQRKS